jgi:hypothetical protein
MHPELDNELRGLFDRNAARALPHDPFLSVTQQRIAAIRSRRRIARALAHILVIASIALASPWLIEGSVWFSRGLDAVFARSADFLGTPVGIGLAALGLAIAIAHRWWRHAGFQGTSDGPGP